MSYETELQQNNLDLQTLIEKANSLPSSSEVLALANAYTDNPTVEDLTNSLVLTPGDNCAAANVLGAYKTGNIIILSVRLTTPSDFSVEESTHKEILCNYEFQDSSGNLRPELAPVQTYISTTFYSDTLMGIRLLEDQLALRVFGNIGSPGVNKAVSLSFIYICKGSV